jgi:ABC-type branched-subunit amino acid transport system ATPase component
LLAKNSYLEIASVDIAIAETMAALISSNGLGLAGAVTVASGILRKKAEAFLTNDESITEVLRSLRGFSAVRVPR